MQRHEAWTIQQALAHGMRMLEGCSGSPHLDAQVLLAGELGVSRAGLVTQAETLLTQHHQQAYLGLLARRAAGEPVAYLTGVREFWSLPLAVSRDVLVPRPETEVLVAAALDLGDVPLAVLELGTGSGAIALALASERPRWHITATDISPAALAIARANAQQLSLATISWHEGSWFAPVAGQRFDLIISNPPYIAASDAALPSLACEPLLALEAGPSGLEALRAIIAQSPRYLQPGGWLMLEHGWDQGAAVAALLRTHGFAEISLRQDFAGQSRVALARHTNPKEIP